MLYTHILVPTDFSSAANQALRFAFEEAIQHQARVTLVHVMSEHSTTDVYYVTGAPDPRVRYEAEFGGKLPSAPPAEPATVRRDYQEEATDQLRQLVPDGFIGTCDAQVIQGHPADAIVRLAQELPADLIVMGTHGRTGLAHVLLGSVAEKVVRHAPCPVLTVRYKADAS